MKGIGEVPFKIGGLGALTQATFGVFGGGMTIGDLADKLRLDLYFCPECGKVEFSFGEETKQKLLKLSEKQPVEEELKMYEKQSVAEEKRNHNKPCRAHGLTHCPYCYPPKQKPKNEKEPKSSE